MTRQLAVFDLGGTHLRMAFARVQSDNKQCIALTNLQGGQPVSFADALQQIQHYLQVHANVPIEGCAVAVCGPVQGDCVQLPKWQVQIECAEIAKRCNAKEMVFINDLAAYAYAIPILDRQCLSSIVSRPQTSAELKDYLVIGPGTGLGVAYAQTFAKGINVLASEAGQMALPAFSVEALSLLNQAQQRDLSLNAEAFLSGGGIEQIHCLLHGEHKSCAEIISGAVDRPAAERESVALFCRLLGAFCFEMALTFVCRDHIYLSGGILPRLPLAFCQQHIQQGYLARARQASWFNPPDISLLNDANCSLLGVAHYALTATTNRHTSPAER